MNLDEDYRFSVFIALVCHITIRARKNLTESSWGQENRLQNVGKVEDLILMTNLIIYESIENSGGLSSVLISKLICFRCFIF